MNELTTRVVTDPDYRSWAVSNPREFLAQAGVSVPDGIAVRVVEAAEREVVVTFPPLLEDASMVSDDALVSVVGGTFAWSDISWTNIPPNLFLKTD